MTKEEAATLVENLIQAAHDYEFFGGKYYRTELNEMRVKVEQALMGLAHPSQQGKSL